MRIAGITLPRCVQVFKGSLCLVLVKPARAMQACGSLTAPDFREVY